MSASTDYQAKLTPFPEAEEGANLTQIFLEKLWLIVLMAVAGFFTGFALLEQQPLQYMALGVLEVEGADNALLGTGGGSSTLDSADSMNTMVANLLLPSFLLEVSKDPSVQSDLTLFPPKADGSSYTDQERYEIVAGCVNAQVVRSTHHIIVSAVSTEPATAQHLCDAVLNNYVKDRLQSKTGSVQENYKFLTSEADRVQQELGDAEHEIAKYDQLGKINDQINDQKTKIAGMAERYKPKHPAMIEANAMLKERQDAFDAEMLRIIQSDKDAGLKPSVEIDPAVGITEDDRTRMMSEYEVLKREIETQSTLFQTLVSQRGQTDVNRSDQSEKSVQIVDHPVLPDHPIPKGFIRYLGTGMFIGAVLGMGLSYLLSMLDRTIKRVDDVEILLRTPVLCAVPETPKRLGRSRQKKRAGDDASLPGLSDELQILDDPNSPYAESFRSLRAAMSLIGTEDERRSVIFTSGLPGEGKSFVCSNYAVCLAQQELRTLLIDADLRRPKVQQIFGFSPNTPGLSEYLTNSNAALSDLAFPSQVPNLDLLLAGKRVHTPAELLAGMGFTRLLEEALPLYHRIVIDTAPVNPVGDTLVLLNRVDQVLLVLRANSTPREAAQRALRMLDKMSRPAVGIVFNRVQRRPRLGYHNSYYYHYGSTSSYGDSYGKAYEKT